MLRLVLSLLLLQASFIVEAAKDDFLSFFQEKSKAFTIAKQEELSKNGQKFVDSVFAESEKLRNDDLNSSFMCFLDKFGINRKTYPKIISLWSSSSVKQSCVFKTVFRDGESKNIYSLSVAFLLNCKNVPLLEVEEKNELDNKIQKALKDLLDKEIFGERKLEGGFSIGLSAGNYKVFSTPENLNSSK